MWKIFDLRFFKNDVQDLGVLCETLQVMKNLTYLLKYGFLLDFINKRAPLSPKLLCVNFNSKFQQENYNYIIQDSNLCPQIQFSCFQIPKH